jgi:hypothetical protein
MRRPVEKLAAVAVVAALALAGCTSPSSDLGAAPTSTPTSSSSPTAATPPDPGPTPKVGECHDLTFRQAVWFTPSQARADAGADWFRCDVVVVTAPRQLLRLPRRTKGWGDAPAIAMCATAAPGTKRFKRVTCGVKHSWVAVATVDIPGRRLPGQDAIADRMEAPCRDAARSRADDPLDFTWSQESPTAEQWHAGRHYGICWAPS